MAGRIDVLASVGLLPPKLQSDAGSGAGLRVLTSDGNDVSAARVRQTFLLAPVAARRWLV